MEDDQSTDDLEAPSTDDLKAIEWLNERPPLLLTKNSNLGRDNIWSWTLPAGEGQLADGRDYNACPSSGICIEACYATTGAYHYSSSVARHQRNLAYVLDDLPGWTDQMIAEIGRKRPPVIVRPHDAGDFFSDAYTKAWLTVMAAHPDVRFYAYTKEVARFKRLVEPDPPPNFDWVYSYGGKHDALLDEQVDRVCDVFPTVDALKAAGYHDQAASDLLAVDGPAPVGMAANNIRHFLTLQGDRTFRTWQAQYRMAVQQARTDVLDLTALFDGGLADSNT